MNADGYTFRINYNAGTGNDAVLTLLASPIEQWRFARFGSLLDTGAGQDGADPDGDGSTNLLEYATRMNPAANDSVPQAVVRNGAALEFTYSRNKSATDVSCAVEWADSLTGPWSTAGVSAPSILSDDGLTQRVQVSIPAGSGVIRRFARLKVTRL